MGLLDGRELVVTLTPATTTTVIVIIFFLGRLHYELAGETQGGRTEGGGWAEEGKEVNTELFLKSP